MGALGSELDDRTRILLTIIRGLSRPETWSKPHSGYGVWFDISDDTIRPGDLVLCLTSGLHDATVGIATTPRYAETGRCLVRVLGSNKIVDVTNEAFYKIMGLHESDLWEGEQRKFYYKVMKAFVRGGEYWYRYGGLRFTDDTAIITIREAFGGLARNGEESVPFDCEMAWNKNTSIKAILDAMKQAGYGTHKFERRKTEATNNVQDTGNLWK